MRLVLLLLLATSVQASYFDLEELNVDLDISGKLNITKNKPYIIEYINANLSFFPKETKFQKVFEKKYTPNAIITDNLVSFQWEDPKDNEVFTAYYKIKVSKNHEKVKSKIKFPITNLEEEYQKYTEPTKNIESNDPNIILRASNIVEGKDDLFEAVFEIASWIKTNINYSLDTLTAKAVQKSTWVLENRYGVCDEITNLLIAMLRSVGIPARYVSGLAYTNYNERNDWGPHAWAEVYFPDVGWISFDITYSEFGYVDPSHIVLLYSLDSETTSASYQWKAKNVNVKANPINFNTFAKESKPSIINTEIKPKFEKNKITFGSYNLLEIEFINKDNFYKVEDFQISKPNEIEIIGNPSTEILLKPFETKKVQYIIKTANLDENYIYEFPVAIITKDNKSYKTYFTSSKEFDYFEEKFFKIEKQENKINTDLEVTCKSNDIHYINEIAKISCNVKNTGNSLIKNLKIKDKVINLGIAQQKEIKLQIPIENINKKDYTIKIKSEKINKNINFRINVTDHPKIKIKNITYPKKIQYKDEFNIEIQLDKISYSVPKKVKLNIYQNKYNKEFQLNNFSSNRKFVLKSKGNEFDPGINQIRVIINYQDNEITKSEEKTFNIELENTSFIQKTSIFFRNLMRIFE